MNRLKLVRPTREYEDQVMAYKEVFDKNRDSFDGCAGLEDVEDYEEWLDFEGRLSAKYKESYVPSTVYLAVRTEDNKVIGMIDYRHRLSDFLLRRGGNIGYSVLPAERGKGYAKEMLCLMIEKCKEEGVKKLLLTCNKSNTASAGTIIYNGGVLENEVDDPAGPGKSGVIQRYWIHINPGKQMYRQKQEIYEKFEFRNIRREEAEQAAEIERICFPPNEACSREMMLKRVAKAPELFLAAVDKDTGKIAGFLNGLSTDENSFRDEFFTDAELYDPEGRNVMLLGLDVLPQYRGRGLARELMSCYLKRERKRGRKLILLTCLESKVEMYEKMGFRDMGISRSVWGGEQWHEMSILAARQE